MADSSNPWTKHGVLSIPGVPAPSGPYNIIGCEDVMTDTGLLVRLFYPSSDQDGSYQYAEARPHPNYTRASFDLFGFEPVHWMTLLVNHLTDPRVPALLHAPLLKDCTVFPVIVFSHGLHGYRTVYSGICCDLASYGFVVASVEHKDQSACVTFNRAPPPGVVKGDYSSYTNEWIPALREELNDFPLRNKQLNQRRSEVSEVLDLLISLNNGQERVNNLMGGAFDLTQFTGCLNTLDAAVMGHSFGGATTVQTLATDKRFKCGVAMDTWMYPISSEVYSSSVITQPLLFINSSRFQWEENLDCMRRLTTPPDTQTGISRVSMVTLKHTTHYNQTDAGFTLPAAINSLVRKTDVYQTHATNCQLCMSFLKRHLVKDFDYRGRVPLLDGGRGCSDHVIYDSYNQWMSQYGVQGSRNDAIQSKL